MKLTNDIVYRADHDRGKLDLYLPETPGPYPVVVAIHGGAWRQGDKDRVAEFGRDLVAIGIAAVAPNHRLTGTDPHPAQQDDIFAVLDWIVANADEYGFDPHRVGIVGSSSGGHLTSLVGLKATKPVADGADRGYTVRCIMPLCGPHNIRKRVRESTAVSEVYAALLGGPPHEMPEALADISSVEHVHLSAPVCLAVHGENDETVSSEQSAMLVEALRGVGVRADLVIVPDCGHGRYQPNTDPPEPLGGTALFQRFFAEHLLGSSRS
jgi:acetyl esterase/lipase